MKSHTIGYLYAILAAFFFSFIAIIGKGLVTSGIHPLQLTFYQYSFTVMILGCWLAWKKPGFYRAEPKRLRSFALLGIIGSLGSNIFFYCALQYLDAGITSMLLFVHPVYVTLFFALTKIRAMKPVNYISVALAVLGAVIVLDILSSDGLELSGVGVAMGIASGLTYAFYNVLPDLKLKSEDPNVINFFASGFGLLTVSMILAISGIGFRIPVESLPSILLLASISGILPIFFIFKALQHIGSEKVTVVASMELPITLVLAFTFLGEHMKPIQLMGVLFIVASTVLLHQSKE